MPLLFLLQNFFRQGLFAVLLLLVFCLCPLITQAEPSLPLPAGLTPSAVVAALPRAKSQPATLVFFKSPFCKDCKQLLPKVQTLSKQRHWELVVVDITAAKTAQDKALLRLFQPTTVPMLVGLSEGQVLWATSSYPSVAQLKLLIK